MMIIFVLLIAVPAWVGAFRDDFEDGDMEGWIKFGEGKCAVNNGILVLEMFEKDVKGTLVECGDETWKVDTLTFDINVKKKFQENYSFAWSMRIPNGDYGIVPSIDCALFDGVIMVCGYDGKEIFGCRGKDYSLTTDKWYKVKVVVNKSIVNLYVDDELIVFNDWKDKPIPDGGRIDFWTAHAGEYHLDNIIVTGAGVPNTGPSGINSPFFVGFNDKLTTAWGNVKK